MRARQLLVFGVALFLAGCGGGGKKGVEIAVPCRVTWTATGVQVKPGQRITIQARGELKGGGFTFGPEGTAEHPEWAKYSVVPEWPHLALIGRVGEDGDPFLVGKSFSGQVVRGGELFLGVNDLDAENNDGTFHATVVLE
jgi:hypothetical protein